MEIQCPRFLVGLINLLAPLEDCALWSAPGATSIEQNGLKDSEKEADVCSLKCNLQLVDEEYIYLFILFV